MKTDLVVGAYIFFKDKLILIKHHKSGLWLPCGGHIDEDEVPDDAIIREAKEELNLDIFLLNKPEMPKIGHVKRILSNPFHVNIHSVKDHDHCCFFYLAIADDITKISLKQDEIDDYMMLSKDDLSVAKIPEDVRIVGNLAFECLAREKSKK